MLELVIAKFHDPHFMTMLLAAIAASATAYSLIMPLFNRDLLVVTDEATGDQGVDWPKRCWIVDLRLEGLRYPEIGSVLGISSSAVGEFLRRAISRLKKDEL